ncbi:MAG: OB-fold nucleic acid binding domain-containing protein [Patescibacteria group bacterium]|nr:OB-fold nucleic acid binding domain-containing protein [Patescibacteria group bacterium]
MERTLIKDTINKIGQTVLLQGWVKTVRTHGGLIFLDLRDSTGVVQSVVNKVKNEDVFKIAKTLTPESSVEIICEVNKRPEGLDNAKMTTGGVEAEIKEIKSFVLSKTPPFPVDTEGYEINEEIRLKYRYLDIRRQRLSRNLHYRSQFINLIREYFLTHDFVEVETPYLSSPTPEGARDFLVPSRLQKGKFYALPQSPQQYKQLLMVAGLERYFQIARCFRDEDPRADRAYGEFTQLDLEMSFVQREDVMAIVEDMLIKVYKKIGAKIKEIPFPIYTYQEALKKFGSDKFDLRSEEDKKQNVQAFAWVMDFPFFEKTEEGGWTFTHNPFSAPLPEFKEQLLQKKNIAQILTSQYDLVCNGLEVGGGSIRSHEAEVLKAVFEIMGYKDEEIKAEFGHMLEAFSYGTPPHGGIAPGIDRLLSCLLKEPNLREVIAFPMSSGGKTAVMDAPAEVSQPQLNELSIMIKTGQKDQSLFESIKQLLNENKMSYDVLEHEAVYTSQEAAKVRGTKISQGAKALIMVGDKKPLMVVLPADRKVDFKKLKASCQIKDLKMASAEEVKKIAGVEIGAVPPFGNLMETPLYLDKNLAKENEIVFNAGMHTKSILMKYSDYLKAANPVLGDYTS